MTLNNTNSTFPFTGGKAFGLCAESACVSTTPRKAAQATKLGGGCNSNFSINNYSRYRTN